MVNYSLVKRKSNPMDPESEEKVYAVAQIAGTIDVDGLARHIVAHNSKYNRSDVKGVIESVIDCMIELMQNGFSIQLGEFGTFYFSLTSKGVTLEELAETGYNSEYITKVKAAWRRGKVFSNQRSNVEMNLVPSRTKQKSGIDSMIDDIISGTTADKDTEPGAESGGSGGGSAD